MMQVDSCARTWCCLGATGGAAPWRGPACAAAAGGSPCAGTGASRVRGVRGDGAESLLQALALVVVPALQVAVGLGRHGALGGGGGSDVSVRTRWPAVTAVSNSRTVRAVESWSIVAGAFSLKRSEASAGHVVGNQVDVLGADSTVVEGDECFVLIRSSRCGRRGRPGGRGQG
jgi:hypothetical protein